MKLLNQCTFPHYRIVGNIKTQNLQNGSIRVSFVASSYAPVTDGIYHKIMCFAFDDMADEIIKSGADNGSIIDLACEERPFKAKSGNISQSYKVYSFSPVPIIREKESQNNDISSGYTQFESNKQNKKNNDIQTNNSTHSIPIKVPGNSAFMEKMGMIFG